MRREVRLWIDAAKEDLFDADDAMRRGRWFRAAFLSQQAVEKALRRSSSMCAGRSLPTCTR